MVKHFKKEKKFNGFGQSNKNIPQLNFNFEKIGIMINPITANSIKKELTKLRKQFFDQKKSIQEEYFKEGRKIIGKYIKGSSLVQPDDYSESKDSNSKVHSFQLNLLTAILLNLDTEKYIEYGLEYSINEPTYINKKADIIVFPKFRDAIIRRRDNSRKGNVKIPYLPDFGGAFLKEYQNNICTLRLVPEHTITMIDKDMCAIQFCVNAPLQNSLTSYIGVIWFSYMRWHLKYKEKINNNQTIDFLVTPWEEQTYIAEDQEQIIPFQIVDEGKSLFTVKTEESLIDSLACVCGYLVNHIE